MEWGDHPEGGWSIKNDERVKYVGKLEVSKGEDQTLKVRSLLMLCGFAGGGPPLLAARKQIPPPFEPGTRPSLRATKAVTAALLLHGLHLTGSIPMQVTMEDYPEAGMSALKYYTIQSYTKWCVTPPLSMPPQAFAAANRPRYLPAAPR